MRNMTRGVGGVHTTLDVLEVFTGNVSIRTKVLVEEDKNGREDTKESTETLCVVGNQQM